MKTRQGVAFDIPEQAKKELVAFNLNPPTKAFSVEFPTELPELEEEASYGGRSGGRGGYQGY